MGGGGRKQGEDALQEKQDKPTTQRGERSLVREPTARLACLVFFLSYCFTDKKKMDTVAHADDRWSCSSPGLYRQVGTN